MARWCVAVFVILAAFGAPPARGQENKIESAINLIKILDRPGHINLATVWDGNKYVQCRTMDDRSLRCESAGTIMQPSLEHVLTPERMSLLLQQGWLLDPNFGNYVRTFAPETSAHIVAHEVFSILTTAYDADPKLIEIEMFSVANEPCPTRNGATQNLAGAISDAHSLARFALHACAYTPQDNTPERKLGPDATVADLIALYGPKFEAEIERLRLNIHRDDAFVYFDTGLGYVQCATQLEPDGFYCEAQSADSWPALAAVLTPDRVAHLHDRGYSDPGRAPNYSKIYPADKTTDKALATELLTLLHDVYGYYGASKLDVGTEER
jgi:hypothetical protein